MFVLHALSAACTCRSEPGDCLQSASVTAFEQPGERAEWLLSGSASNLRVRPRAAVGQRLAGGTFVPEAGIQRAELEFDKFSVGGG